MRNVYSLAFFILSCRKLKTSIYATFRQFLQLLLIFYKELCYISVKGDDV